MAWGRWVRKYGVHALICAAIVAAAFRMNEKITLDRSHEYVLSGPIYSLLKEITEVKIEDGILQLSGWGFDTIYGNDGSQCELILLDTETGEALWPRMEKGTGQMQVPEKYANGEEYPNAGFMGGIEASRLEEDSVYEVLLRYTSNCIDEDGKEQKYIRTVTTDRFIYGGEMTEYDPKAFLAPEIDGTGLEEELKKAKLFCYFPEGMWVYYDEEKLFYIVENSLLEGKEGAIFPVHWYVRNSQLLPEGASQYGYGNSDFYTNTQNVAYSGVESYTVAVSYLDMQHITYLDTGLYYKDVGLALRKMKQAKAEAQNPFASFLMAS